MRGMSFLVERSVKLRETPIPRDRLERANQPQRKRLDDDLAEAFHFACGANDVSAAGDLLLLLEKWHAERRYDNEQEWRHRTTTLKRLRGELDRQHFAKGLPAAPANRWTIKEPA